MPVSAKWYGKSLQNQYAGTAVNWTADTIKVALTTSTYTPNQDTHDYYDDITNEVANGNGYTTGGTALAGKSINYDTATNAIQLRGGTAQWTGSFTARYAVIYKDTGNGATSPLMGYVDFGGDETISSATLSVVFDQTEGVLKIAAA